MSPARLGVNVDHVATLRQARRAAYPDPVAAALLAELGGADQITIHLREDRRHIQDRDLQVMRKTVTTRLNLEMAATQEMVKIAYEIRPDEVTLVPERREELTTEGGLDVVRGRDPLAKVVKTLRDADILVSLFIDPDLDQVKASHRIEAQVVEIHTGRYCDARLPADRRRELARIVDAAKAAAKLGLQVAAGHGLHYQNVLPVAAIPEIEEFNIGHSIVGHAVLVGMERAVREMKVLLAQAAEARRA
ncbi:MAG TPA: pyridoxine 5'-phosphate synthase [Anaeromyxobacteraceae bacterium]|nr:pyridoxine 5'-phosphate synthase [Anaeromyxobacteraceae bacterium]